MTSLLKFDTKNLTLLTQKQKLLADAVTDTKDKLDALRETQRLIDEGKVEATAEQYRDLEREIASTEAKLRKLTDEQREFASVSAVQLQAVGKEFQTIGQKMSAAGEALLPLTAAIAAVGAASVAASIEFESSFAGVRKTVDATEQELLELAEASRAAAMAKPVDVNEINQIMELGGQLGIATDYLSKFASVVGDLSVSTNLGVEDASMQLSQFMNICSTATEDIDRLGATLVGLGNNSATTEAAIMEMAMRIAGSGSQIGMTESQILGFSASLASVGINAEAGGSAISQIMSQIDKDVAKGGDALETWAATAGMSAQQFADAWYGDAAGAIMSLMGGMQEAVESGSNINLILEDLGVTALRQTDTLKRLTSASDLMASTIDVANTSWEENVALTNEAEQRYATTESRLVMLKNEVVDIGISLGNGLKSALVSVMEALQPVLDGVQGAARAFEQANPAVQTLVISAGGLAAGLAPMLIITGKITSGLGSLMAAMGKSAAAFAAKSAATAADTASTTANTAATGANTLAVNAQIIRNAIKEATDIRLAAGTAAKTAATAADTVATNANTAATGANATATGAASIKMVAFSVAAKAKAAAATVATVAQLAWNAAMTANPIGAVIAAASALAAVVGVLAVAITSTADEQDKLTASSERQQKKIDELQAAYDEAVKSQGEHSDAAVQAKYALDQETAAFEASKETLEEFNDRCAETVAAHDELATSIQDSGREADTQAGKILYLASEIERLSSIEGRSAEDKARLAALTQELNASCEGLNATYDEQNDVLGTNVEAIRLAAEAEADRVRAQAAMDSYSSLLSEQIKLEMQLAEAQENLQAEKQANIESWGMLGDMQVFTSQAQLDLEESVRSTSEALEENAASQQQALEISAQYSTRQSVLSRAIEEVANGTITAEAAAERYASAVEGGITADEIRAGVAHEAALAEEELAQATNEAAAEIQAYADAHPSFQAALERSGVSVEALSETLALQGVKFEEAAKAIEEYSARSASAFDKIGDSAGNSLDAMLETLAYNLEATENWSANLEAVFGRSTVSFSQEFVNAVQSGGVEQFGTVMAQLAEVSDEELQKISDSFARNGQAGVQAYLAEQEYLVPGMRETLDGVGQAASDALETGETAAAEAGAQTGAAYGESLAESISSAPEEVQAYIADLRARLASSEDVAAESGTLTGINYSESLQAAIASCPAEVQACIGQLEAQLQAAEGSASQSGQATGEGYSTSLLTAISNCPAEVQAYIAELEAQLKAAEGAASQSGQATGASYSQSLTAAIAGCPSEVQAYISQLEEQLKGAEESAAQSGFDTGSNFSNGLADSLASAPRGVLGFLGQLGSSLFGASAEAAQAGRETGAVYLNSLSDAIASDSAGIQSSAAGIGAQLEGQLSSLETQAGELGSDAGQAYGTGFAAGMQEQVEVVAESASNLSQTAQAGIDQLAEGSGNAGTQSGKSFASGILRSLGAAVNAAVSLRSGVQKQLSKTDATKYGLQVGTSFGKGISGAYGSVYASARSISSCVSQWSQFGLLGYTWGYDAGFQFARGLNSTKKLVKSAATNLAEAARSVLHFSVPDEGPLADADEYGPDFGRLIAEGLLSTIGEVRSAAESLASTAHEAVETAFSEPAKVGLTLEHDFQGDLETTPPTPAVKAPNLQDSVAQALSLADAAAAVKGVERLTLNPAQLTMQPLQGERLGAPFREAKTENNTTNNYYIDGINVNGTTDGQFAAEFMSLMQRYGRLAKT